MNSNYTGPQLIEGYLQKKKRRIKGGMKTNWRYLRFSLNDKERTLIMKNKKEDQIREKLRISKSFDGRQIDAGQGRAHDSLVPIPGPEAIQIRLSYLSSKVKLIASGLINIV